MTPQEHLQFVQYLQSLYPKKTVKIEASITSCPMFSRVKEWTTYRISVHENGDFSIGQSFDSKAELLKFLHDLGMRSTLEVKDMLHNTLTKELNDTFNQKSKNRIKDL